MKLTKLLGLSLLAVLMVLLVAFCVNVFPGDVMGIMNPVRLPLAYLSGFLAGALLLWRVVSRKNQS